MDAQRHREWERFVPESCRVRLREQLALVRKHHARQPPCPCLLCDHERTATQCVQPAPGEPLNHDTHCALLCELFHLVVEDAEPQAEP